MPAKSFAKKKIAPFYFLHGQAKIKYEDIPIRGQAIMDKLMAFIESKKIKPIGPAMWEYEHLGNGKTVLRAGFPVKSGAVEHGRFKLEKTEAWNAVVTEYKGSMEKIMEAWIKLNIAVAEKGIVPINQTREVYKKWFVFDSKKNVTELQMRVK